MKLKYLAIDTLLLVCFLNIKCSNDNLDKTILEDTQWYAYFNNGYEYVEYLQFNHLQAVLTDKFTYASCYGNTIFPYTINGDTLHYLIDNPAPYFIFELKDSTLTLSNGDTTIARFVTNPLIYHQSNVDISALTLCPY